MSVCEDLPKARIIISKVQEIIDAVKKYESDGISIPPDAKLKTDGYLPDELLLIVGDSKYPTRKRGNFAINVPPFSTYTAFNFKEVAFLCDKKTIELFSIIGIFFDSMDDAAVLINQLINPNRMGAFARYLLFEKNLMLVNASGAQKDIDNLLHKCPNHKVLFCCGKKKGYGVRSYQYLDKSQSNGKYNQFLRLNHPSSRSYLNGFERTCSCYLDRTYEDDNSNLSIQDFKIF